MSGCTTRAQYIKPRRTGTSKHPNRIIWLLKAIDLLKWYFDEIDRPLPEVSIIIPWPEGSNRETLFGSVSQRHLR
jgi:hypothetical protein